MHAKLYYNASGWTATSIIADMKAIIAGETDVANLSVDAINSEITTTVAHGWTMHDDISTTEFVIKAPLTDDGTKFKYVHIYTSSQQIRAMLYEQWDEVGHSGTYPANSGTGTTVQEEGNVAQGTTVHLNMSEAHFYATSLVDDNVTTAGIPTFISEHTRDADWDTPAAGYLPVVQNTDRYNWPAYSVVYGYAGGTYHYNTFAQWPRIFSPRYNADRTQDSAKGQLVTPFASNTHLHGSGGNNNSSGVYVALNNTYHTPSGQRELKVSFGVTGTATSYVGGDLSSKCGIYFGRLQAGISGDEVDIDGITYTIIRQQGYNFCMLIPKR